ncbi:hypothetical protein [Polymorphobacter fuscus]|uniref:Uncharacterized protein n=1 Tax=Sandarakinorhabdus fusca TaxID=1439888 RepID=A0A7C9GNE9_9SPHN|nr:hypothetical protein [Polymorphobacter fuscus]KAB7647474.1 hypothetical protein F9290_05600 [Polymorphobacter fuscus]MQT16732.1 hypothetical protein [Polymorphobacter fuscus]NJC09281.1 hypothetical protein [Polymorphobacter fuscus]
MDDLDRALQQLRTLPVPIRLAALESDVLLRIDSERNVSALTTGPVLGLAASLALGIGIGAAILPGGSADAGASLFSAGANLAPSTLLANLG